MGVLLCVPPACCILLYIWCFTCATSSCCSSVKQLSSQLSISCHHSLLSSSDTLIKTTLPATSTATLLSSTQIIKQRLWFYNPDFQKSRTLCTTWIKQNGLFFDPFWNILIRKEIFVNIWSLMGSGMWNKTWQLTWFFCKWLSTFQTVATFL